MFFQKNGKLDQTTTTTTTTTTTSKERRGPLFLHFLPKIIESVDGFGRNSIASSIAGRFFRFFFLFFNWRLGRSETNGRPRNLIGMERNEETEKKEKHQNDQDRCPSGVDRPRFYRVLLPSFFFVFFLIISISSSILLFRRKISSIGSVTATDCTGNNKKKYRPAIQRNKIVFFFGVHKMKQNGVERNEYVHE